MNSNEIAIRPAQRVGKKPVYTPHPTDYTPEEVERLTRLMGAPQAELLAAFPGRSWAAIRNAAARRGLKRPRQTHQKQWEGEPMRLLLAEYPTKGAAWVAKELGRSEAAIRGVVARLKLRRVFVSPCPAAAKLRQPTKRERERAARREARTLAAQQKAAEKQAAAKKKAQAKAKVKAKPASKPKPVVVVPEPVKRSPATPILNARAEQRRLAKALQAQKPKPFVTAEQLKAAPQPVRWAYTCAANRGPAAATEAFYQAMSTYKQAA